MQHSHVLKMLNFDLLTPFSKVVAEDCGKNATRFSISLIGTTFLSYKHIGTLVVSQSVKQCMIADLFPHILTGVVDIQKAPFVAYTSEEQNMCILLQYCASSMNTSASGSDVLIFRQCSINIVIVSASSWNFGYSLVVFTGKTEHLFINNWDKFLPQQV